MLKEIHFLLTYTCNYMCDHCFLFADPDSEGTFTINDIKRIYDDLLDEGIKTDERRAETDMRL